MNEDHAVNDFFAKKKKKKSGKRTTQLSSLSRPVTSTRSSSPVRTVLDGELDNSTSGGWIEEEENVVVSTVITTGGKALADLSDLTLEEKDNEDNEEDMNTIFHWTKGTGKKKMKEKEEPAAKTWTERQERLRHAATRPQISNESQFPTLGGKEGIAHIKKSQAAQIATSNPWFSLHKDDDSDEEKEDENGLVAST